VSHAPGKGDTVCAKVCSSIFNKIFPRSDTTPPAVGMVVAGGPHPFTVLHIGSAFDDAALCNYVAS